MLNFYNIHTPSNLNAFLGDLAFVSLQLQRKGCFIMYNDTLSLSLFLQIHKNKFLYRYIYVDIKHGSVNDVSFWGIKHVHSDRSHNKVHMDPNKSTKPVFIVPSTLRIFLHRTQSLISLISQIKKSTQLCKNKCSCKLQELKHPNPSQPPSPFPVG